MSEIPQLYDAFNIVNVFANDAHVVIVVLRDAYNFVMDRHDAIPMSEIPHLCDASNMVNVFANGSHVVILTLLRASNF